MTATADVAGALRTKFFEVATELFALPHPGLLVSYGLPGVNVPDDLCMIRGVRSEFTPGAMATNRQREETLEIDLMWWIFRAGEQDAEQEATEFLYARLGELEKHIRVTDPTLGGLVRECALLSHEFDTTEADGSESSGAGRLAVANATFQAKVRIRNDI